MEEGFSFEGPEGKVTLSGVSQECVGVLFGKLEKSVIKFAGSNRLGGEFQHCGDQNSSVAMTKCRNGLKTSVPL